MNLAYMTLATNKKYLEGAKILYYSYLKTNSKYPFYIMVLNNQDIKGYEDLPLLKVSPIVPTDKNHPGYKRNAPNKDVFNKFNLWLLEQFDYVYFMDADCIMLYNIDSIAENAIMASPCADIIATNIQDDAPVYDYIKDDGEQFYNNRKAYYRIPSCQMIIKPNASKINALISEMNTNNPWEETVFYTLYKRDVLNVSVYPNLDGSLMHISDINHDFYNVQNCIKYWEIPVLKKIINNAIDNPQHFYDNFNRLITFIYESDQNSEAQLAHYVIERWHLWKK